MIELKNKILLNLEEQVQYLTNQVEMLKSVNLKGYVKIVGNVNNIEDLPEDYSGSIGDFYLVINTPPTPNDLYMWGNTGGGNVGWTYCGPFPLQGPRGAVGQRGATGATGDSTKWTTGIIFPNNPNDNDIFLNTTTYDLFQFRANEQVGTYNGWHHIGNIKGQSGRDGNNGNSIVNIDAYHAENANYTRITITFSKASPLIFNIPDGTPGSGFHVSHIWPEDPADMPSTLPNDIVDTIEALWPAENADPSEAVLVKTSTEGDFMFVILTEDGVQSWDEAGQIQSVQGPQGIQGYQGVSITNVAVNSSNHVIITMTDPATSESTSFDAGAINVGAFSEFFIITAGTTSYQDIIDAINDGLHPICIYNDDIYQLASYNSNYIYLSCNYNGSMKQIIISNADAYSYNSFTVQSALTTSTVIDGTIDKAMGFDSFGNIVKSQIQGIKQITGTLSIDKFKDLILNIIKSSFSTLGPQKIINVCIDPSEDISVANYKRNITVPANGNCSVPSGSSGTSQYSMSILRTGYWNMFTVLINNIQTNVGTLPTSFTLVGNSVPSNYMLQTYIELGTSYSFRANLISPPALTTSTGSGTLMVESGIRTWTSSQVSTAPTFTYKITYIDDGNTFTIPT